MASHRRPKQPGRTRVTVLTATAAAAVALSAQAAHADSPSKADAKAKVDKLYEEAEQATEKYNGAKEKQDKLEKQVSDLQDKVARGQEDVNKLRDSLGTVATAQYRSGAVDPSLQLLLSSDPDTFLEKASTIDQLTAKQADTLKQMSEKQRTLKQQRQQATDKLKDLDDTRKALADRKDEVQGKLADAKEVLNSLSPQDRAEVLGEGKDGGKGGAGGGDRASRGEGRPDINIPAGSGRGGAALAAAYTKEGIAPYVWGATGPSSFDCSGLTSWAYAQAGVTISRVSQDQANDGTRIYDQSQLKPGDLVLFYGDLHHVGLYAGNGMVLHAPKPGTNVRTEAMSNMPFQFGVRIG
ncbi:NlpC/P60 family protein [Streptomyces sp. UNOC14_S4]|uniref:C40 family peptidase n=1 Tax=Streptomyces sp. UNOC14_S4 TaxID=2872340 RepID=UPI001E57259E|nr:C40 family peptidase [Streptomyces sp. UNOC14_S4]MCC3771922.1 C40 family peptidase [Streptomyces sp. UNOC14_S4]